MWTSEDSGGLSDLLVKAAVTAALSNHIVSADFYEALDEEITELLEAATAQAAANDRKTV